MGVDVPDDTDARSWRHAARYALGKAISARANEQVPDEWFEPLPRAAVHEPDPSFSRQLVGPAMAAFGRRRVMLALLGFLESSEPADVAGAAKAWYHTGFRAYAPGYTGPAPDREAERTTFRELHGRYRVVALRRFVADEDLDVRRRILPGLPLDQASYPAELHDLVAEAVRIARTSDDYLRHRVEIQVRQKDQHLCSVPWG
ncbi:hypothetical protein [Lentzea sp. E54]|uniref:hypothetical protein n=1 Tax=Lentzea xerophila TaxID=3435883 RepID=UPI003DA61647